MPTVHAQCFEQELWPPGIAGAEEFGFDLDVGGGVLVIGDRRADNHGQNSGAAYVYAWDAAAGAWSFSQELMPSVVEAGEGFGREVSTDGERIAVISKYPSAFSPLGRVRIFAFDGTAWYEELLIEGPASAHLGDGKLVLGYLHQLTVLDIADGAFVPEYQFGFQPFWSGLNFDHVVVEHDDDWIVVSEPWYGCPFFGGSCGRLFLFHRQGESWSLSQVLEGTPSSQLSSWSQRLESERLAIGLAPFGTAIYRVEQGTWVLEQSLTTLPGLGGFGSAVDLEFPWLAVGAPSSTLAGPSSGAIVLYEWDGDEWVRRQVLAVGLAGVGDLFGYRVRLEDGVVLGTSIGAEFHGAQIGSVRARRFDDGQPLLGCPASISLSEGGTQKLSLHAPAAYAGQLYWVLGSVSGTAPGIPVDGLLLPLAFDAYTVVMLTAPNQGPFEKTLSVLGSDGYAGPNIVVAAASDPGLVGLVLHHAFVVLDPVAGQVAFASNPSSLALAP
ncbi:MAG TPA: FG-GAP repeat protein [Planctomycetota bacterium]|nr:FG-GAP repeat protein [Planctomycetota bacterium]